jgi:hypothetical protein
LGGILLIPRLRPSRLDGIGPNVIISASPDDSSYSCQVCLKWLSTFRQDNCHGDNHTAGQRDKAVFFLFLLRFRKEMRCADMDRGPAENDSNVTSSGSSLVIALLGELTDKGIRPALVAVFLYSSAIKPQLLPLMIHYFGLAYTLLLIAYLLLFSLLIGMAMEKLDNR